MDKKKLLVFVAVILAVVFIFNNATVRAETEFLGGSKPLVLLEEEEEEEEIVEEPATEEVQTPVTEEVTTIVLSERPAITKEYYYEEPEVEEPVVEEPVVEEMKEYKADATEKEEAVEAVETETTGAQEPIQEPKTVNTGDIDLAQVLMIAACSLAGAYLAVKQKAIN